MNTIILIASMFINSWGSSVLIHPVLDTKDPTEVKQQKQKKKKQKKHKEQEKSKHDHNQFRAGPPQFRAGPPQFRAGPPQFRAGPSKHRGRGWDWHKSPVDMKSKKIWYLETNLGNQYI